MMIFVGSFDHSADASIFISIPCRTSVVAESFLAAEISIGWAQSATGSFYPPCSQGTLIQALSSVLHLTLSTADGGDAAAFRRDEVGIASQASFSVLA